MFQERSLSMIKSVIRHLWLKCQFLVLVLLPQNDLTTKVFLCVCVCLCTNGWTLFASSFNAKQLHLTIESTTTTFSYISNDSSLTVIENVVLTRSWATGSKGLLMAMAFGLDPSSSSAAWACSSSAASCCCW